MKFDASFDESKKYKNIAMDIVDSEKFDRIAWMFGSCFNAMDYEEERIQELLIDRDEASKEKIVSQLSTFIEEKPIDHLQFEDKYGFDFSSTQTMYEFLAKLQDCLSGKGEEPDIVDYLAD